MSALVRPLLWLAVFAAGFRNVFGVSIVEPYDTYIPYDVYIAPGLIGMVLLFNGMQSQPGDGLRPRDGADAAAADRAAAALVDPALPSWSPPRCCRWRRPRPSCSSPRCWAPTLPVMGSPARMRCWPRRLAGALMLGALGLLLSVHVKQLENFAGTMNFVIFPMYFMSTALYPLWKLEESGAAWVYQIARFNPFTHAVEWLRFALYGKDPGSAPWVVLGTLATVLRVRRLGLRPAARLRPIDQATGRCTMTRTAAITSPTTGITRRQWLRTLAARRPGCRRCRRWHGPAIRFHRARSRCGYRGPPVEPPI